MHEPASHGASDVVAHEAVAEDFRAGLRERCDVVEGPALLAKLAGVPVEIVAPDGSVLSSDSLDDAD